MTEQNDNKQVFNKDDAKKALKTLTTFGLQQGSKLANLAGEKMTKWSKQVGQKLDVVRDHHEDDEDDEDDEGPLSGDMSVKSLSDFIKRAAYNKDLGIAMASTASDLPDGFTPDAVLDMDDSKVVFGSETESLQLGDLKFKIVRLSADIESMDLLEVLSDTDDSADASDHGVLVLTGLMSFVLQDMFVDAPVFKPLSGEQTEQYLKMPINFVWSVLVSRKDDF